MRTVRAEKLSLRLQQAADGLDTAGDSSGSQWMENFAHDARLLEQDLEQSQREVERLRRSIHQAVDDIARARVSVGAIPHYISDRLRAAAKPAAAPAVDIDALLAELPNTGFVRAREIARQLAEYSKAREADFQAERRVSATINASFLRELQRAEAAEREVERLKIYETAIGFLDASRKYLDQRVIDIIDAALEKKP